VERKGGEEKKEGNEDVTEQMAKKRVPSRRVAEELPQVGAAPGR